MAEEDIPVLEVKVRRVRTPAGSRRFHEPIGAEIKPKVDTLGFVTHAGVKIGKVTREYRLGANAWSARDTSGQRVPRKIGRLRQWTWPSRTEAMQVLVEHHLSSSG